MPFIFVIFFSEIGQRFQLQKSAKNKINFEDVENQNSKITGRQTFLILSDLCLCVFHF